MQWKDLQPNTFSFILVLWLFLILHGHYWNLSLIKFKASFSEAKISSGVAKKTCCPHNISAVFQTSPQAASVYLQFCGRTSKAIQASTTASVTCQSPLAPQLRATLQCWPVQPVIHTTHSCILLTLTLLSFILLFNHRGWSTGDPKPSWLHCTNARMRFDLAIWITQAMNWTKSVRDICRQNASHYKFYTRKKKLVLWERA